MPEFMILILADEAPLAPAETRALVEAHAAYERALGPAFVDGEHLRPSAEGRRVGLGRVEVGPFEGPALTGYYVVEAASLDAAVALAQGCPGGALDIRPLMKGTLRPGKSSQQGRVFACAVLGRAASEAGWVEIMDAIDASSTGKLDILAGVRLHAPSRGKTTFDGPFLESKEVIGGLFFKRFATVDEAVAWASASPFANHGAVEIRELWRS